MRPDGSEYWSARELMPLLGYVSWRDFEAAVNRAKISCEASGSDVTSNFADARKNSIDRVGRPGQDYELSRFGCYLVAMNGDPRKREIAEAQTYFAVKTREAETGVKRELTRKEILLMALEAEERAELAQREVARVEELRAIDAPKVEVHDAFLDSAGRRSVDEVGKMLGMLGVNKLRDFLKQAKILRHDGLPMASYGPEARGQKWFVVSPQGKVEVTAKGIIKIRALIVGHDSDQGRLQ
jgi:DNA-damage-inducible protein D